MAGLLVLVAVLVVYVQTLGGPFLWDDRLLVLDAPLVERGRSLGDFLDAPFWAGGAFHSPSASYYRPLVTLSFALDHAIHGENPGGYHLTNVLLHAINALFVVALLKKYGTRPFSAALLATGWALLPRLAEAAAWISGRTDLLATAFTLGALLAWGPGLGRRVLSAVLLGVGLFAKESALAGALAIGAGVWVAGRTAPKERRAVATLATLAPLAIAVVPYAVLRLKVVGLTNRAETLGATGRIRTVFEAVGTYAAMLVDAWRPRAVIGRVGGTSLLALVGGIAVVVLVGALVAVLVRRRFRPGVASATGLALFAAALLPVLHVVPIPLRTLAADRFLYLPTVGLLLALAPSVDAFLGTGRKRWTLALALVATLGVVTFRRAGVWSDELEFWVTTYLETPPTNNAAAVELAGVYERAGLFEDELILAERALRYDDPHRTTPAYNAALCLMRLGRYDEARARLVPLRGLKRGANDVAFQLALLEIRAGRFDIAGEILAPLVRAGDNGARLLASRLGELEQARHELDRWGASSPPEPRARLATLLDDAPVATAAWVEVLRTPGVSPAVADDALRFLVQHADHDTLGRALLSYRTRFGSPSPPLAGMIEVRLAELERLVDARARIGLSGPERTQEIAVPGR